MQREINPKLADAILRAQNAQPSREAWIAERRPTTWANAGRA